MKGALFDLDGVLIDSEGLYTEFWAGIDRRFPTGVADFARVIKGNTLGTILNTYFDSALHRQIVADLDHYELTMPYRAFDGAISLLQTMRQLGVATAIVTSSTLTKMAHVFASIPALEDAVDALVTADDVTRSKPDPQGYLIGAQKLRLDPAQCYVFEDSLAGLEAGRRAGCRVVAVATTNSRQALQGRADSIIDTIADFTL